MPFLVEMLFTSISWLLMIVYLTMHQLLSFFNPILQLVTTGLSWWAWAFLYAPKLPLSVQIKHFISISKIYHIPPRKACHLGCRDEKKKASHGWKHWVTAGCVRKARGRGRAGLPLAWSRCSQETAGALGHGGTTMVLCCYVSVEEKAGLNLHPLVWKAKLQH